MESLPDVYVVGGRQRPMNPGEPGWNGYVCGVVNRLSLETGRIEQCLEHVTPPEARPDDGPSVLFKAATLHDGRLTVCTTTEVLRYRLPTFELEARLSLPSFNDIHHVHPAADGGWLVANTGLDMVLDISPDGEVRREWAVLGGDPWQRFGRDTDYRKVNSTKPHLSHPNQVFLLKDQIWTTRCDQFDAVCLTAPGHIQVGDCHIHDGLVRGDSIWFTQVNGRIIEVDARTLKVRRVIDLNYIAGASVSLGWCRGLELLGENLAVVGFSRLRPTKWRDRVVRLKYLAGGKNGDVFPTRVCVFDLENERMIALHQLEDAGMHAVFSIHTAARREVSVAPQGRVRVGARSA